MLEEPYALVPLTLTEELPGAVGRAVVDHDQLQVTLGPGAAIPLLTDEPGILTCTDHLGFLVPRAALAARYVSVTPLRLISKLGYLVSFLSFVGLVYVGCVKIFAPETAVPGWAFLGVAMFFLGGIQMIMLGVLGSYIGRTYSQVQNRPLYTVASVRTGSAATVHEDADARSAAR